MWSSATFGKVAEHATRLQDNNITARHPGAPTRQPAKTRFSRGSKTQITPTAARRCKKCNKNKIGAFFFSYSRSFFKKNKNSLYIHTRTYNEFFLFILGVLTHPLLYTAFPCKILNGMMTLRHDDIMTLRPDCMMPCKSMSRWWAVCGSNAGRSRGGILFFLANFSEFSSKAHHPLGEFSQKFSAKLSPNFLKLSPKGVKSGLLSPKLSPLSPKSSLFTPFSSPKW